MKGHVIPIPGACLRAQAEIEANPLDLAGETEAHVRTCPACSETRVAWLAQQEASALAPAGYFEQLPDRILSKLPAGPRRHRPYLVLWALAAVLLAAVGAGGFLAGRANQAPTEEAALVQPAVETHDALPDAPFQEGDDEYTQLPNLTPEEAHQFIERVGIRDNRP